MTVRPLALLVLVAASSAAAPIPREDAAGGPWTARRDAPKATRALGQPKPLRGVPLAAATRLRLLVASDPPFVLDVDSGRTSSITGLDVSGNPVLSVLAVGRDAVVWLDRRQRPGNAPTAEIYVIRGTETNATPLATAWQVAPSADGAAVWLKSYADVDHCTLREVRLDGEERQTPRPLPCSAELVNAGGMPLLVDQGSVFDPQTETNIVTSGRIWAMSREFAVAVAGSSGPVTVIDVRSRDRWRLRYPSRISGQGGSDEAAVHPNGRLFALSFSDPAFGGGGSQVTDVWLLNAVSRRFHHLPDMPAFVSLKFTSMSWTRDGRLVMLAESTGRDVVAVWRAGQRRIAVRRVSLPNRNSGSDSFVVLR
jgi:hypothetical protein